MRRIKAEIHSAGLVEPRFSISFCPDKICHHLNIISHLLWEYSCVYVNGSNKRCLISSSCAGNNICLFWYAEINRCLSCVTHTLDLNRAARLKLESTIMKMCLAPLWLLRCICLKVSGYLGKMITCTVTDGSLKNLSPSPYWLCSQCHVKNESCACMSILQK